ncbi:MAG: VOC family protein [Gammaproteobacteria bacterium]|jgi:catechol 2,3-dioxygenase-like lactoylglutathione lyase family enzyme|nr:VOC family protein [Gammaproteobacteria bacterium]
MVSIIKRTTLIVRDIDTSVRWYQQVLGLEIYYDDLVEMSGTGFPAGGAGDQTRLVILRAQDPEIGMIGLLQWLDPPLPAPAIPTTVSYGAPTFVVHTDDVNAAWEQARGLGTRVQADPHRWSIKGANGRIKHFLSVFLFDPDGHFFELNQLEHETDT